MSVYNKHNYLNKDILTLKTIIREYDMSEAGFSLIKQYSLLPKKKIKRLEENFTKEERTIEIGKMMLYNTKLSSKLMKSFKDIRKEFFEANELEDSDILSIKKDAIFVISKQCEVTEFDNVVFKLKNTYSSYYNLGNCEFYYSRWKNKLDVKGISNKDNPLIEDIKNIIRCSEFMNKNDIFLLLKELRDDYLNLELEIDSYREMNSNNAFKLKKKFNSFKIYYDSCLTDLPEEKLEDLDISYNYLNFILPLISILV